MILLDKIKVSCCGLKFVFTNWVSGFNEIQIQAPLPELLFLCLQNLLCLHMWLCTLSFTGMFNTAHSWNIAHISQSSNISWTDTSQRQQIFFFLSFFLSFFLPFLVLTSVCLLTVGVEVMLPLATLYDTHSVGLLWTNDQPVAETSTWQHTTKHTDIHVHAPAGFELQSQQASNRRPTS